MKEHARNVAVGLTVLVALACLAAMILIFAGLPEMFQPGYEIDIQADTTFGAEKGAFVNLRGIRVGRITEIGFTDPADPMRGVTVTARIESDVRIPGNAVCYFTRNLMGGVWVELYPDGPERIDPATGQPIAFLPTDGHAVVPGVVKSSDPASAFRPAMESLSKLADSLNELIAPEPKSQTTAPAATQGAVTHPAPPQPPAGLKGTVARLNRTLDAMYEVLEPGNRANIKTALANLSEATAAARDAMDALQEFAHAARKTAAGADKLIGNTDHRIDELMAKLVEDAEKISELMTTMNRVTAKIDSGDGSAGRLINDPKLYDNLVEVTKQANTLVKEFSELLKEWRKGGVKLKMD